MSTITLNLRPLPTRTTIVTATPRTGSANGNRYVASYNLGEIRVYNAAGTFIGNIAMRVQNGTPYDAVSFRQGNQGNASNAVFGGPDMKTLYISGDGGLFSIRLKVPGRLPQGPVSLKAPVHKHKAGMGEGKLRRTYDVRGRTAGAGWSGAVVNPSGTPHDSHPSQD